MTDISYSYTVGGNQPAKPAPAATSARSNEPDDPRLWSFTGVELISQPDGLTLLIDTLSDKRLVVQEEVGITLTYCEAFRTLRGHAEHLVTVLPQLGGQVEPIIPVLAQIRDAGLLRQAEEFIDRFSEESASEPQAPIAVFIITCDRPAAVERLLASMRRAPSNDLPQQYTLIDDSRDDQHRAENVRLVDAHNAKESFQVSYFGMEERARFIEFLIGALPDCKDSIHYLLRRDEWGSHPTYGLARSLALLLGVNRRTLIFDDDVLCEAVRPPLAGGQVAFGSINGRQAVFYDSLESLDANKQLLAESPIALMSRQLGLPLARGLKSLCHGALPTTALAKANGAFVRSLNPDSTIIQTQCSTWGDPGTGSGHWIVDLDAHSIERLLNVPAGVVATVDARASFLGYDSPTLTKHGVMSQVTGYDARQLLPPFLPAFRGEDALFSYMLTAMHPRSLVLNHAWGIHHRPLETRASRNLRGRIAAGGGISLITRWIADNVDLSNNLPATTRLNRIALSLEALTELDEPALINFARLELAKSQSSQLEAYRRQLERADLHQSTNWSNYLRRGYDEISAALRETPSLDDLLAFSVTEPESTLAALRHSGKRFAAALQAWPALWEAAKGYEAKS